MRSGCLVANAVRRKSFESYGELDTEIWDTVCRRMRMAVERGDCGSAHRMLDDFIRDNVGVVVNGDTSVHDIGLSCKLSSALYDSGFLNVRSLVSAKDSDLLDCPGIRMFSLMEIRKRLSELGMVTDDG